VLRKIRRLLSGNSGPAPRAALAISTGLAVAVALTVSSGCSKQGGNKLEELEKAGKSGTAGASATQKQGSSAAGEERRPAPDFSLRDLDGREVSLSQMRGKVVILNFWATWCPPCRQEIPDFVDLQKQYGAQGLQIVGVSMDQEGASVVRPFVQQNHINYTMLVDGQKIAGLYGGIQGIPTTFILDRQGRIAKKAVGFTSRSVFEKLVTGLLKES